MRVRVGESVASSVASGLDHADRVFSITQAYPQLFCSDTNSVLWPYSIERELDANGVIGQKERWMSLASYGSLWQKELALKGLILSIIYNC